MPTQTLVERKRCRGASCQREIAIVTLVNGNRMPIDPEPSAAGRVLLQPDGLARVLKKSELETARRRGFVLYNSHFVTCPEGPQFRAKQRSRS